MVHQIRLAYASGFLAGLAKGVLQPVFLAELAPGIRFIKRVRAIPALVVVLMTGQPLCLALGVYFGLMGLAIGSAHQHAALRTRL
jgi:hypothetical protein